MDESIVDTALDRIKTQKVDGYDLFILELMFRHNILQIITDDGDFATIPGIKVFTSNRRVNLRDRQSTWQIEIFIFGPDNNQYIGCLCIFNECPKEGKKECRATGCGEIPFVKKVEGFTLYDDALAAEKSILLYQNNESKTE